MKTIDRRFDLKTMQTLQGLIGEQFEEIRHGPFFQLPYPFDVLMPTVKGITLLRIGGETFALTNRLELMDYFGEMENTSVCRFDAADMENPDSLLESADILSERVDSRIAEIRVVNENQRLYHLDEQTYDVHTVRCLIFVLEGGRQIAFEKGPWCSEDIYLFIDKHDGIYDPSLGLEEFAEGWEGEYRGECSRDIISIH